MTVYKCPVCGRSTVEVPQAEPNDINASTLTIPSVQMHVHCKSCGWSGPVSELTTGH